MEFKNNITLEQRILFVNSVVEMSKVDGVHEPALYDFAFRASFLIFFSDADAANMELNDLYELAYSEEVSNVMHSDALDDIVWNLDDACEKKIKFENKKYLIAYNEAVKNDPWGDIAKALDKLVEKFNMDEFVTAVAKNNLGEELTKLVEDDDK